MVERTTRVLLIEDNPGDARLVREMLAETSGASFDLERADRLSAGLERLSRGDVDVVLLDLSLPDSVGLQTFLRADAHAPAVPIIVLTGADDETLAAEAVHAGAQDYLVKGLVDSNLLVRAMRYAIGRKRAEEALRESEERYALAVAGARDGLWDWNVKTGQVHFSPRWKAMLGFGEGEIGTSPDEWFARVHPEDAERVKHEVSVHLDGLTAHFESEHRLLHKDGTHRWMLSRGLAVRDGEGKASRMAGSQTDITERKIAEAQLLHDALHDALTGLPNRALFMDRLEHSIVRARRRPDALFAVLFLDLDRFKVLNDSLGHVVGDQLLVAIAQRLRECLRTGDTVARLGGDEFAILLDDVRDEKDAVLVADRIQQELRMPFSLSGHEVFSTASLGIASSGIGYDRAEDLLRDADTAMYRAKGLGRARHAMFDTAMHTRAVVQLQLETDLRRTVERLEFVLHYQPIVALETGRVAGVEALVRWQHPRRGLVAPGEFIPVAEETGLIIPMGWWVLREACRQMRAWKQRHPGATGLWVSVNLSVKQFTQPDLIEQIAQTLRATGLEGRDLKLEITESAIMEDAEAATAMLARLRDLGVRLSIDDFGTGYSSLSYLHRLPIDTLKIDRSFVTRIGTDGENTEIARTIVGLALSLQMDVIAEGIETAEQLDHLKTLGCTYGQGYLFSKPLDGEAAGQWLARESRVSKAV